MLKNRLTSPDKRGVVAISPVRRGITTIKNMKHDVMHKKTGLEEIEESYKGNSIFDSLSIDGVQESVGLSKCRSSIQKSRSPSPKKCSPKNLLKRRLKPT